MPHSAIIANIVRQALQQITDETEVDFEGTFMKTSPIEAVQMGEVFEVATLEGKMKGKPGDWLAEGVEGERWPIDKAIFEKTYEPKTAAEVGTDTATILAISPEALYTLINEEEWREWADAQWGDSPIDSPAMGGMDPFQQMELLIRQHGGAVFHTGGDGGWDVKVHGARSEAGFLPPYGTSSYGRVATRYLMAKRVALLHQGEVVKARMKQAGWWQTKDQDQDGPHYLGDGPLDVRIDFIRKIDEMYRRSWNRSVSTTELRAIFEVPAWADDDGQELFGLWPVNQWVDVAAKYMDVPQSMVLSLPEASLEDARRLWREVRNSRIQVGTTFTKDTVLPDPDKELVRGFLDHIRAAFMFAREDAVQMVDTLDPEKVKLATSKTGMTTEASVALMKWLSRATHKLGVARHVYVVGGAVRNFLIDQPIKDIDMVVDSLAIGKGRGSGWLTKELARMIPTHTEIIPPDNLTVSKVLIRGPWVLDGHELNGEDIEIVNARLEEYEKDPETGEYVGHKPIRIEPTTLDVDVTRREFTFNTLMWRLMDLADGPDKAEVIDLTGCGIRDLESREMRCPMDADDTFARDPTRIIRTIKFAFKYGFKLPPDTKAAAKRQAKGLKRIPSKAWGALRDIVLESPDYKKALLVMDDLGIMAVLKEMMQENKQFRSTLAEYTRKRGVAFMFDLMDLGLPLGAQVKFMSPAEQKRFRDITVAMEREDAQAFLGMVKNPGNAYKDKSFFPYLAEKHGIGRKQMGQLAPVVMEVGRGLLLSDPGLAKNPSRLKQLIEQGVEKKMPRKTMASRVADQAMSRQAGFRWKEKETRNYDLYYVWESPEGITYKVFPAYFWNEHDDPSGRNAGKWIFEVEQLRNDPGWRHIATDEEHRDEAAAKRAAEKHYANIVRKGLNVKRAAETSHVGLFIPVPEPLASEFPSLGDEDTSKPHATLLYVGDVPADRRDEFLRICAGVLSKEPGPIKAWTNGVDSFSHPEKNRQVFYTPVRFSRDLGTIRDRLATELKDAGFEVANSFPLAFNAHATLAYSEGLDNTYTGVVPNGNWEFSSVMVWGLPKEYELGLGSYVQHDKSLRERQQLGLLEAWGDFLPD